MQYSMIFDLPTALQESYLISPRGDRKAMKTELDAIEAAISRVHGLHRARVQPTGETTYTWRRHGSLGLRIEVIPVPPIVN